MTTFIAPSLSAIATPVRIDGGKPWYDITHPTYAAPIDGVTDAGIAINAAISAASTAGGGIVLCPPTASMNYALSTRLVGLSNVELRGVPGLQFKWIGATATQMLYTNPAVGVPIQRFDLTDIIFNTSNTSLVTALFLQSWQSSRIFGCKCVANTDATAIRIESNIGTDFNNNCHYNTIYGVRVSTAAIGLQLSGISGTGPTVNWFYGLRLDDIYQTGIRLVQFCDSNNWYGTRIAATGVPNANWAGVIMNDSGTPGSDVGVYNELFEGLAIDNSNGPASASAVVLNWQRFANITLLYSGIGHGSPGTTIKDNFSQSHAINDVLTTGGPTWLFKNWKQDSPNFTTAATFTGPATFNSFANVAGGALIAGQDLRRSFQTPTEAVLVSGVSVPSGELIEVTLSAARLVGAPLNTATGQRITFTFIQGGGGAFAITWNAVFKVSWSDVGNAAGKRSSISFYFDGTNWNQDGGQTPYV